MTHRYPITVASAFAVLLIATLFGPGRAQAQSNILMIIADDVGVDMIGAYEEDEYEAPPGSNDVPPTPTLDRLAKEGMLFRNVWSNPMCATTRATIQTGRYSYRTGVRGGGGVLPSEEFSIAEILNQHPTLGYATAIFGKWGLATVNDAKHPIQTGYDHFQGAPPAGIPNYVAWIKYSAEFDTTLPNCGCDVDSPECRQNTDCIEISTEELIDDPDTPEFEHYATT